MPECISCIRTSISATPHTHTVAHVRRQGSMEPDTAWYTRGPHRCYFQKLLQVFTGSSMNRHVPEIFCTLLWQVSENMFDLHVLKCSAKNLSTSKHAIRQCALLMQQIKLAFQKHRIYDDLPQCAGILRLLYHLLMRCYWYSFPCNLTNND